MGLEKITRKLQEALHSAQGIASKSALSELKSAHVLLALLQQEGGIAVPILQKAGVDITRLKAAVASALSREPSVQRAVTQPQISIGQRATLTLVSADEIIPGGSELIHVRMTVIQFLIEILFYTICGWVGHIVVKAITFGKVDLDWGNSSESVITEYIGAGLLIALATLISLIIGHG